MATEVGIRAVPLEQDSEKRGSDDHNPLEEDSAQLVRDHKQTINSIAPQERDSRLILSSAPGGRSTMRQSRRTTMSIYGGEATLEGEYYVDSTRPEITAFEIFFKPASERALAWLFL